MERTVALKKLRKILGDKLGYRVDPKASDHDERIEARKQLKHAIAERDELRKQKDARMSALLQADAEFQRLKALCQAAANTCNKLTSIANSYRFTVGTSGDLFFTVKAQGDSWEDVIAELTQKRPEPLQVNYDIEGAAILANDRLSRIAKPAPSEDR